MAKNATRLAWLVNQYRAENPKGRHSFIAISWHGNCVGVQLAKERTDIPVMIDFCEQGSSFFNRHPEFIDENLFTEDVHELSDEFVAVLINYFEERHKIKLPTYENGVKIEV